MPLLYILLFSKDHCTFMPHAGSGDHCTSMPHVGCGCNALLIHLLILILALYTLFACLLVYLASPLFLHNFPFLSASLKLNSIRSILSETAALVSDKKFVGDQVRDLSQTFSNSHRVITLLQCYVRATVLLCSLCLFSFFCLFVVIMVVWIHYA